jgi:hypothetical protein
MFGKRKQRASEPCDHREELRAIKAELAALQADRDEIEAQVAALKAPLRRAIALMDRGDPAYPHLMLVWHGLTSEPVPHGTLNTP